MKIDHSVRFHHVPVFLYSVAFLFLLMPFSAMASADEISRPVMSAESQWAFAQTLYNEGRWQDAALEFRRFLHLYPTDRRLETAMLRVGQASFSANRFQEAVDALKELVNRYAVSDPAVSEPAMAAYWLIAHSYEKQGQDGAAVLLLHNLIALTDDAGIKDEARYRTGWLFMEGGDFEKARVEFSEISPQGAGRYRVAELLEAIEGIKGLARKNPELAGILSAVPGLGQAYCERYNDALIAFLINALAIAASWEAFDGDNVSLGIGLGLLSVGFYSGNIYNAVSSAHKFNRAEQRRFIDRLKGRFVVGDRGSFGFVVSAEF